MDKQEIIDLVIEQIKKDLVQGDVTSLEILLEKLDIDYLKSFLPEGLAL